MSQKHNEDCIRDCPTCPCNTCKHDGETVDNTFCCVAHETLICLIFSDASYACPDYEAEVQE